MKKTVAIHFSFRITVNKPELEIDSHRLAYVGTTKYLGVIIDRAFSYREHIDYIRNKTSKSIGILYRISRCTPAYILRNLYNALILPYLSYCNLIWGNAVDIHLNKLLLLQKRAVRVITSSEYLAHTDHLFREVSILKIAEIYKYSCCMYVFNNRSFYETNSNIYGTRNCNSLKVSFQRLNICKRSVSHNPPNLFNKLPVNVANMKSRCSFKKSVKQLLTENQL